MATVVVQFSTKTVIVPSFVKEGKFSVSIPGVGEQLVDGSPATFDNVPFGDYVVSVQRKDEDGLTNIGEAVVQSFSVLDPGKNVDVPDVVTVVLS